MPQEYGFQDRVCRAFRGIMMDKIGQRAASVKRKRIILVLICMLLVLNVVCLTGCGAGKKWKDGKCTISIECSAFLD